MSEDVSWNAFVAKAREVLELTAENKVSLEEASQFFEHAPAITDEELRHFLVNSVWEIDGSPGCYAELVEFLRKGPTEPRSSHS
jgi:hypothetical protein